MSIRAIDSLCLGGSMISAAPVTAYFGEYKITGTTGARNSAESLISGGIAAEDSFRLLASLEAFAEFDAPAVGDVLNVCVTSDGIPCAEDDDDVSATRLEMRVMRVGRAGAAITFELVES